MDVQMDVQMDVKTTVPFACMKGDLLGRRSKKAQPPWAMLSLIVNVLRLVWVLFKYPPIF
jgi:hypothetical protein